MVDTCGNIGRMNPEDQSSVDNNLGNNICMMHDINANIAKQLFASKFNLIKARAWIIRKPAGTLDGGNFFNEFTNQAPVFIPICLNVSMLINEGTKDDKTQIQQTDIFNVFATGDVKVERTDRILWDNKIFDVRNLNIQRYPTNNVIIYQKFDIVFIQAATDFPKPQTDNSTYPDSTYPDSTYG